MRIYYRVVPLLSLTSLVQEHVNMAIQYAGLVHNRGSKK